MVTKKLQAKKLQKGQKRTAAGPLKSTRSRTKPAAKRRIGPLPVAALLATLVLLVLLPYIRSGRFSETGARVPEGYHAFCIDLSHHNGTAIVWDSLRVAIDKDGRSTKDLLKARSIHPVSAIYIKATEGGTFKDRRFADNWEQAGLIQARRGAYHFFRTSVDPLRQADHFIATVGPLRHNDLPPVLDIETMHRGCTPEVLNEAALAWLEAVEKHYRRKPVVYAPNSYVRDILSPEITEHYPLWIARYSEKQPDKAGFSMWQFTDRAVIHGIRGYVDLSVIPE